MQQQQRLPQTKVVIEYSLVGIEETSGVTDLNIQIEETFRTRSYGSK